MEQGGLPLCGSWGLDTAGADAVVRLRASRWTGMGQAKRRSGSGRPNRGMGPGKPAGLASSSAEVAPSRRPRQSEQSLALERQALQFLQQNRAQDAETIYRDLIAAGYGSDMILSNLAGICGESGRVDECIALLEESLAINPINPQANSNLGLALLDFRGDAEAARLLFEKALRLKPDYPEALNNLGNALLAQGEIEQATACYNKALALDPVCAAVLQNSGNALLGSGDVDEAIRLYGDALELRADYHEANFNLGLATLLKGDYVRGWLCYESRFKVRFQAAILFAQPAGPRWQGSPLAPGDRLLVVGEQGLGDTLQFMRYVLTMRQRGVVVSLCAQPALHELIRESGIDPDPLSPEQAAQVSEVAWVPLLSLPRHLGVSPEQPLITEPYIRTPESLLAKWKALLADEPRPIIAINWQGNPSHEKSISAGRSLPLEAFAPIANCTQASLLSLQKGFGSEQLDRCSFRHRFVRCQEQVSETWDFLETAAMIANCDLVISSDTSVAHLAGGMGQPTWLLLKHAPEWRWGLEGDTSFWYPSMRLFRQRERGNWQEVLQRVAEAVQHAVVGAAISSAEVPPREPVLPQVPVQQQTIMVPISLGELIDKITILRIKVVHLSGLPLQHVRRELTALEQTLEQLNLVIDPMLIERLQEVNQDLWLIEDQIRDQERQKRFGETFVRLARSVYQQNDRRAAIKKEINGTYGSVIVEEKSYQSY